MSNDAREAKMPEPVARLIHRIAKVDGLPDVIAKTYAEYAENFYPATWREGDKLYGPEVLEMLAAEKLRLAKVMEGLREPTPEMVLAASSIHRKWENADGDFSGGYWQAIFSAMSAALLRTIEGETPG